MENTTEELRMWDQLLLEFERVTGHANILTHFRSSLGNGFTISTDMTTEQLIACYADLAKKPKCAAQILSITFALTLHLL